MSEEEERYETERGHRSGGHGNAGPWGMQMPDFEQDVYEMQQDVMTMAMGRMGGMGGMGGMHSSGPPTDGPRPAWMDDESDEDEEDVEDEEDEEDYFEEDYEEDYEEDLPVG
mmetsp:Transcript_18576/g.60422  ORF Transcript_18576/g.60422 Transcript_18576/m.60422 type:complete len:112 (+) Transcript_18576:179-514(+)